MTNFLNRGISTDYDVPAGQPGRYVLTEEYQDGYVVVARFKKLADAKRYLENTQPLHSGWSGETARRRVGGTFGS